MVYSLRYRRPGRVSVGDHVSAISTDTKRQNICESVKSGRSAMSNGIPEALSFDTIVAGGACPVSASFTAFHHHVTRAPHDALLPRQPLRFLLEAHALTAASPARSVIS